MTQRNSALISEDDLKEWLDYDQRPKIEQWLSDNGIPFQLCRGRIVTTLQAINNGLIGLQQQSNTFEFE